MGRRSRKRGETTRRARRRAPGAAAAGRQPPGVGAARRRPGPATELGPPPAPLGSFPLSELVILLGIVLIAWGAVSGEAGEERLLAGLVIASLGGGELRCASIWPGFARTPASSPG